jgi:hypothetical protein
VHVLDRLLKLIVTLTLLLFLVQTLIGLLARALNSAFHGLISGIAALGGMLGAVTVSAVLVCLAVGLVVRATRFLVVRDPRVARERVARERAGRTRVRRPADDTPVHQPEEPSADPDPAINEVAD